METKPAVQTTEFWKSLSTMIVGAGILALGLYKANDTLVYTGMALLGVTSGAYSLSRGMAKTGIEYAPVPATPKDAAAVISKLP